ncbi:MAG: CDP-glycerol glycerophosphotransferase family protein, partial [Oscillospiraceae bacterium]
GIDVSVLLCACDILISDYSSLIFEYSLLARPMIFYAYDLDEYDRERSFYYPYREFVPGEIVSDTNQIINAVENIEKSFDSERVLQFCQKFMSACDGQSTKRIIKWIK